MILSVSKKGTFVGDIGGSCNLRRLPRDLMVMLLLQGSSVFMMMDPYFILPY
jgi:hypothetical protein